jgi:hypothetical protein
MARVTPATSSASPWRTRLDYETSKLVLRLELEGLPDLQRRFGTWHSRSKHDRMWQSKVSWGARAAGIRGPALLLPFASIICVRYSAGKHSDYDNLAVSFKPLIDALKPSDPKGNPFGVGLILDDGPSVLLQQDYAHEISSQTRQRVAMYVFDQR